MSRKRDSRSEASVISEVVKSQKLKISFDSLKEITPLTKNQELVFEKFNDGYNLFLHGVAGTGKTFLAFVVALEAVLQRQSKLNKIVVVRSAVPTLDIGHLPGDIDEKTDIFQAPYRAICAELFPGIPNAYDRLVEQKYLEFLTTSYLRGLTLNNTVVIYDECQNSLFNELDTVITRLGKNSRIIFSGDYRQTDLKKDKDKSGLNLFIDILEEMKYLFHHIEFTPEDIVRSGLVKEYILAKLKKNIV